MRSIFVGTVEISWACLATLIEINEQIVGIFAMPAERGTSISAYKSLEDLARRSGSPLYETATINDPKMVATMAAASPEIIYVIGWPRLVREPILSMPSKGCVGIHSSLLPKYRGGAPVNWGLINGEPVWGVSLMYLGAGADDGDVIAQRAFPVALDDTCKSVYEKCTMASQHLLRDNVPLIAQDIAPRTAQDHTRATVFPQRRPDDGRVDWNWDAWRIYNWIRALTHPYPGAFTFGPDGRRIVLWAAELPKPGAMPGRADRSPGTLVETIPGAGVAVQTSSGQIIVTHLQPEGEPEVRADEWNLAPSAGEVRFR